MMVEIVKISSYHHCPFPGCLYANGSERYFTSKRFLTQHIHKVHDEKKYVCNRCRKGFGTAWLRVYHERCCGFDFTCSCGLKYLSKESLLTHARRRQHELPVNIKQMRNMTSEDLKEMLANPTTIVVLVQPIIQQIFTVPYKQSLNNAMQPILSKQLVNDSEIFLPVNNNCLTTNNMQVSKNHPALVKEVRNLAISPKKIAGTQTCGDFVQFTSFDTNLVKSCESMGSQCCFAKQKARIVSTCTQTLESSVAKKRSSRLRKKSVAVLTESPQPVLNLKRKRCSNKNSSSTQTTVSPNVGQGGETHQMPSNIVQPHQMCPVITGLNVIPNMVQQEKMTQMSSNLVQQDERCPAVLNAVQRDQMYPVAPNVAQPAQISPNMGRQDKMCNIVPNMAQPAQMSLIVKQEKMTQMSPNMGQQDEMCPTVPNVVQRDQMHPVALNMAQMSIIVEQEKKTQMSPDMGQQDEMCAVEHNVVQRDQMCPVAPNMAQMPVIVKQEKRTQMSPNVDRQDEMCTVVPNVVRDQMCPVVPNMAQPAQMSLIVKQEKRTQLSPDMGQQGKMLQTLPNMGHPTVKVSMSQKHVFHNFSNSKSVTNLHKTVFNNNISVTNEAMELLQDSQNIDKSVLEYELDSENAIFDSLFSALNTQTEVPQVLNRNTQTSKFCDFENILFNMETQTSEDFFEFSDLEFLDIETQTPCEENVNNFENNLTAVFSIHSQTEDFDTMNFTNSENEMASDVIHTETQTH